MRYRIPFFLLFQLFSYYFNFLKLYFRQDLIESQSSEKNMIVKKKIKSAALIGE